MKIRVYAGDWAEIVTECCEIADAFPDADDAEMALENLRRDGYWRVGGGAQPVLVVTWHPGRYDWPLLPAGYPRASESGLKRMLERQMDRADALLLAGTVTQDEYDLRVWQIARWERDYRSK